MRTNLIDRRGTRLRSALAAGVALALAVALTACGASSSGGDPSSTKGPIQVGAIVTETGTPYSFAAVDIPQMAKEVFKEANAAGGIDGRHINYTVVDDQNSSQGAAQAARRLVNETGVVMLAGGASFVSCPIGNQLYQQNNVYSIEGIFTDPHCQQESNVAPVNPGPNISETLIMLYGARQLHLARQCIVVQGGSSTPYLQAAMKQYEQISGQKLAFSDYSIPVNVSDFTSYLLRAKAAHCQSIFTNGGAQEGPAIAAQMAAQGMQNVKVFTTGGSYSPAIAKALAKYKIPFYTTSELAPIEPKGPGMAAFLAAAKRAGAAPSTFTEGAYLAATYAIDVLKSIKGPITRQSVSHALETMKPITTPFAGTPFKVGKSPTHVTNTSVKIAKLEGSSWKIVTPGWVTLKP